MGRLLSEIYYTSEYSGEKMKENAQTRFYVVHPKEKPHTNSVAARSQVVDLICQEEKLGGTVLPQVPSSFLSVGICLAGGY